MDDEYWLFAILYDFRAYPSISQHNEKVRMQAEIESVKLVANQGSVA
ncbi:MAG: hypothetical protein R6X32_05580 [Chloroflexota bacterium]|jgi:hypothetical protein